MSLDNIPERFRQRIQEAKEKQLEVLDLSNNWNADDSQKLTQIPDEVFELTHLKTLNLSGHKIQKIPNFISHLSNLEILILSNNQFTRIPNSITYLSNLAELHLGDNKLANLPNSIGDLSNLQILDLRVNQLDNLPNSITCLSNLTTLGSSNNKLTDLPDSFSNLSSLTKLYLSNNQLTDLPDHIGDLSNLTILNLNNNQLTNLPDSFSNLFNLIELHLSNNQLTDLPDHIGDLSNLTILNLIGNPLETPPIDVAKKGMEAIREYFRQLQEEGKDYIYEAKLLIVGEAGAGKTTLAKKILNPDYPLHYDEKTTHGIDVFKWSFQLDSQKEFKVNIWDFGGQAIYHATHQFFLTKRSLYALVADIRREDTDFYYWLKIVELLSDNSPLLIVKNEKGGRQIDIDDNELKGRFGQSFKDSFPTDLAKITENETEKARFQKILDSCQYYFKQLPHVGSALPKTWKRVRASLEQDHRNYISLKEYLEICQDNDFTRREDQLQLSDYLHDLGVCLHFQDSPLLKNTVILKPEWGTDAVYKVLDDKQLINNLGKFTTKDLDNIWSDEKYCFKQAELLELMMRFKLCYKIPGTNDTYIAPQLLTKTKPNYKWDETDNLILRYTYEFMPKGIITQLIVAMHQHIEQQQYVWRTGVVLKKDKTKAEVIEYYDQRDITIRVTGKSKRKLMTEVTYELDKINNSYQRLKYQKLIPCNCETCKNSQNPYTYQFKELLEKRLANNKLTIECGNPPFHEVQVLSLIDNSIDLQQLISQAKRDNKKGINIQGDGQQVIVQLAEQGNILGDFMAGDRIAKVQVEGECENPPKQKSNTMTTKKILVLESNPKGTDPLLLNQEIRDLEAALRNSSQGNYFAVKPQLALRVQDLQSSILREKPRLVHFCGHGTGSQGLVIQTSAGTPQLVSTSALANLFKLFSNQIECVILNACYSQVQASEINKHINYVIGTTSAIDDRVAILFSHGFYGALGEGESIESSFRLGLNRIELEMNVEQHPERKLVPVELEQEHQYLDSSGNLVLTLLKKEPLNKITDDQIQSETMNNQDKITINQGDYQDNSNTLNITGGTINATGAGAFSLGNNYGTIANTINQLPNSPHPDQPGIKELLTQLKDAIESETSLDDKRKTKAFKQIEALATAAQNPTTEEMKDSAEDATTMLEGIVSKLPAAAALVTICKELLPAISHFFRF